MKLQARSNSFLEINLLQQSRPAHSMLARRNLSQRKTYLAAHLLHVALSSFLFLFGLELVIGQKPVWMPRLERKELFRPQNHPRGLVHKLDFQKICLHLLSKQYIFRRNLLIRNIF